MGACRGCGAHLFADEMYRLLEARPEDRLVSACDAYEKAITLSGVTRLIRAHVLSVFLYFRVHCTLECTLQAAGIG